MRSTSSIRSKNQVVPAHNAYEAIYALQGSLREFPLEADLEEERRADRGEINRAADIEMSEPDAAPATLSEPKNP
jgi:hypothetical protein